MRAGFAVFPMSFKNSPEAIAHLLKKTAVRHLLVGGEPILQKLATTSLELLRADGHPEIPASTMPHFEDLYPLDGSHSEFKYYPAVKFDLDAPALIMHSSGKHMAYPIDILNNRLRCEGSTSFPKPIVWSHRGLAALCTIPCMLSLFRMPLNL
jgi:acyl-CoA synthetase (AMP-forming)/AMP-acid ligase II